MCHSNESDITELKVLLLEWRQSNSSSWLRRQLPTLDFETVVFIYWTPIFVSLLRKPDLHTGHNFLNAGYNSFLDKLNETINKNNLRPNIHLILHMILCNHIINTA